jgi:hypothetical protein
MTESWLTKTSPRIDMLSHWDTHYPNNDSIQSALDVYLSLTMLIRLSSSNRLGIFVSRRVDKNATWDQQHV